MKHRYDLTGTRSGLLTYETFSHYDRFGKSVWNVKCDCGAIKQARADRLGRLQSCGCLTKKLTRQKLYKGRGALSGAYWCRVKSNARKRNIPFNLTIDQAYDLFNGTCMLSGEAIALGDTASLDRVDSTKGYEAGNVQWVHKVVNKMKNDMPEAEFLAWIQKVARFQNS